MDQTTPNVALISKNLDIQEPQVTAAVNLLEAGNTIHFITRYRKDETGGLGESKLRSIRQEMARLSALNERKAHIVQSLENQGKLTADLKSQIEQANQSRKLEDLFLPFKPKKTSLAETARQQGLDPLARDIMDGHNPEIDLASRATEFVRVDKGLSTVDEVIVGVKYILAERFSENLKLRKQLRKLFWDQGELQTELIPLPEPKQPAPEAKQPAPEGKLPETKLPEAKQPATEQKQAEPQAVEPQRVEDVTATETSATEPASAETTSAPVDSVETTAAVAGEVSPVEVSPVVVSATATEAATETASTPATPTETTATSTLPAAPANAEAGDPTAAPKKKKKRKKKKEEKDRSRSIRRFQRV